MLARLPQHWLSRLVFPIGGYEKTQVRQLARDFGLPVAEKPDSMEICFIPDGDYAAWLEARGAVPPPGHFVDRTGRVLGRHRGIHRYTIGQRRGLGIPAAHRLFVSEIRPETQEVVLSDGTDLMADTVWGRTLTRWPL
ncbi:MAG: tRNA methyl transferase PRC-barrel domain-containing protein [Evtepia gabavorous]